MYSISSPQVPLDSETFHDLNALNIFPEMKVEVKKESKKREAKKEVKKELRKLAIKEAEEVVRSKVVNYWGTENNQPDCNNH